MIKRIFAEENIEYVSAVNYADCRGCNKRLVASLGFEPRSVIVYLLPYYTGKTENISLYAASKDYHYIIRQLQEKIISKLKKLYPVSNFAGFGDHSPISEIHAAVLCGLGSVGDNGLLLNEKYGSFIFIADILTDIPAAELSLSSPVPFSELCLHCGKCKASCPTGCLRGESFDCLSAITQRKGALSDAEQKMMRKFNTAWGCDLCQTSCPLNENAVKTPIPAFYADRIERLTPEILAAMSDAEFEQRAFAWRGRATVQRNVEILYGSTSQNTAKK